MNFNQGCRILPTAENSNFSVSEKLQYVPKILIFYHYLFLEIPPILQISFESSKEKRLSISAALILTFFVMSYFCNEQFYFILIPTAEKNWVAGAWNWPPKISVFLLENRCFSQTKFVWTVNIFSHFLFRIEISLIKSKQVKFGLQVVN